MGEGEMRQRKRRIGTVLLCAMLAISSILSVGIPVYAQSPDTGTDNTNITYENKAVPPLTEDPAAELSDLSRDAESGEVPDTGNASAAGTDSDSASGSPDSKEEAGNESTGSSDDPEEEGTDGSSQNPAEDGTGNSGQIPGEDGTDSSGQNPGEDSTDDSDNGNGADSSSDITDPDDGSGSTPDDGPSSDTDESTEYSTDIDPDIADEMDPSEEDQTDSEYPIEYPQGISMTNVRMAPKSYSVVFSANIEYSSARTDTITPYTSEAEIYINNFCHGLRILYTTEEIEAADFYKGKSSVVQTEIDNSSFQAVSFNYKSETGTWYDTASGEGYQMTCSFPDDGSSLFTPATVYYYRLAYYNNGNYSFLTAPESFTTLDAVTESSISVKDFAVEEIGYEAARIAWTMDNPMNEDISDISLVFHGWRRKRTVPYDFCQSILRQQLQYRAQ